ncbi:hypothetical protein BGW80DRAFT_1279587 [Lactifluus volemus]|nr:hypothetical protein BGW80DRAFT_1279587 [Lactifluus volemus]
MPKASKKVSSFPFFFFLCLLTHHRLHTFSTDFSAPPLPLRRRGKKDRVDKERPGATATAWMNENGAMRRRLEAGRGTIYSRRTR